MREDLCLCGRGLRVAEAPRATLQLPERHGAGTPPVGQEGTRVVNHQKQAFLHSLMLQVLTEALPGTGSPRAEDKAVSPALGEAQHRGDTAARCRRRRRGREKAIPEATRPHWASVPTAVDQGHPKLLASVLNSQVPGAPGLGGTVGAPAVWGCWGWDRPEASRPGGPRRRPGHTRLGLTLASAWVLTRARSWPLPRLGLLTVQRCQREYPKSKHSKGQEEATRLAKVASRLFQCH